MNEMTNGMKNHYQKMVADKFWHKCEDCAFGIGKYPGRYPRFCPHCGADMGQQETYPRRPSPDAPIDKPLPVVSEADTPAEVWEKLDEVAGAVHTRAGLPVVEQSPNAKFVYPYSLSEGKVTFVVYPPLSNRIAGTFRMETTKFTADALFAESLRVLREFMAATPTSPTTGVSMAAVPTGSAKEDKEEENVAKTVALGKDDDVGQIDQKLDTPPYTAQNESFLGEAGESYWLSHSGEKIHLSTHHMQAIHDPHIAAKLGLSPQDSKDLGDLNRTGWGGVDAAAKIHRKVFDLGNIRVGVYPQELSIEAPLSSKNIAAVKTAFPKYGGLGIVTWSDDKVSSRFIRIPPSEFYSAFSPDDLKAHVNEASGIQMKLDVADWGSDRTLWVILPDGKKLNAGDPFWPGGMPVGKAEQLKVMQARAREVIRDWKAGKAATVEESYELGPSAVDIGKSLHGLVKFNNGFFKSPQQAAFLMNQSRGFAKSGNPFEHPERFYSAYKEGTNVSLVVVSQIEGFGKTTMSKVRFSSFGFILDGSGVLVRVKFKVNVKTDSGLFGSVDWNSGIADFTRPAGAQGSVHHDLAAADAAKERVKQDAIAKNMPMIAQLKSIKGWDEKDSPASIIGDFVDQLMQGRTLSPKQLEIVNKYLRKQGLASMEHDWVSWQSALDFYVKKLEALAPAAMQIYDKIRDREMQAGRKSMGGGNETWEEWPATRARDAFLKDLHTALGGGVPSHSGYDQFGGPVYWAGEDAHFGKPRMWNMGDFANPISKVVGSIRKARDKKRVTKDELVDIYDIMDIAKKAGWTKPISESEEIKPGDRVQGLLTGGVGMAQPVTGRATVYFQPDGTGYLVPDDKKLLPKGRKAVFVAQGKLISEKLVPLPVDECDPFELEIGTAVEKEHTDSEEEASTIARQHLREDPAYYRKLYKAKMVQDDEIGKKLAAAAEDKWGSMKESLDEFADHLHPTRADELKHGDLILGFEDAKGYHHSGEHIVWRTEKLPDGKIRIQDQNGKTFVFPPDHKFHDVSFGPDHPEHESLGSVDGPANISHANMAPSTVNTQPKEDVTDTQGVMPPPKSATGNAQGSGPQAESWEQEFRESLEKLPTDADWYSTDGGFSRIWMVSQTSGTSFFWYLPSGKVNRTNHPPGYMPSNGQQISASHPKVKDTIRRFFSFDKFENLLIRADNPTYQGVPVGVKDKSREDDECKTEAKIAPIDRDEMVRRIEVFLKREWESIPAEAIRKFREAHPRHVYFTKLPQDATPAQLWPEMDIHTHVMKSSKGDHIIVKHPFVKDYAPDFEKHWREWVKAQGWAVQSYDDYNIFVEPNYGSESASVGPSLWHFTFPDKVAGIKSSGLKPSGSKTWGDSLTYEPKVFAFTTYNAALKARKEMYFFATRPVSLIQILPNKLRPGTKWFKDVHVDGGVWTYTHVPAEAISPSVENLPALRAPDKVETIEPIPDKELEDPLTDKGKLKFKHAIAVVVKDSNAVLMGISTHDDDRKGKLCFPGGHTEKGGKDDGDVQAAACREAEEEAGIECEPTGAVFTDDERPKHAFVVCKYVSGDLKSNWEFEKDSLRWVPFEKLDKTDNILDINRKVLKKVPNGQLGAK